jgi:N-acetylglucosamine malate deacetylase 1
MPTSITRRAWLGGSLGAGWLAGQTRKSKLVVVGGHPDDPESGCGGTMAAFAGAGAEVVALYLTRGEAGIAGKTAEEAARIRTREAGEACRILGARPVFAGQVDGATEVSQPRYAEFRKLLLAESPDIVLAHWPVDTHRDHRAASMLAYDAWLAGGRKFDFYYFEVMSGSQTQMFAPTTYVDITATEKKKRDACYSHPSQQPAEFYEHHRLMNEFRGVESRVKYAEAFVRHALSPGDRLVVRS